MVGGHARLHVGDRVVRRWRATCTGTITFITAVLRLRAWHVAHQVRHRTSQTYEAKGLVEDVGGVELYVSPVRTGTTPTSACLLLPDELEWRSRPRC